MVDLQLRSSYTSLLWVNISKTSLSYHLIFVELVVPSNSSKSDPSAVCSLHSIQLALLFSRVHGMLCALLKVQGCFAEHVRMSVNSSPPPPFCWNFKRCLQLASEWSRANSKPKPSESVISKFEFNSAPAARVTVGKQNKKQKGRYLKLIQQKICVIGCEI